MSHSQPHPNRQASSNSASSSGNRTIRADSSSGRRRLNSVSNQQSRILARLTRRGQGRQDEGEDADADEDEEDDMDIDTNNSVADEHNGIQTTASKNREPSDVEAGPSDYWRRSPSPSPDVMAMSLPTSWRQMSLVDTLLRLDAGPYDEYRPAADSSETWSRDGGSPKALQGDVDNREYAKRIQEVFNETRTDDGHRKEFEGDSRDEGSTLPKPPQLPWSGNGRELSFAHPYVGNVVGHQESDMGEEEFGVLHSSQRENYSNKAPSIASTGISLGHHDSPALTPDLLKRARYLHPSVSRLRSHLRTSSTSTNHSLPDRPSPFHSRTPSHFSQISMTGSDSMSITSGHRPTLPKAAVQSNHDPAEWSPAFVFHSLRHLSAHLFSRKLNGTLSPVRAPPIHRGSSLLGARERSDDVGLHGLGQPTTMDIRGMVAVGTDRGLTVIYGFGQELRHILGNEAIITAAGAVSCVTISMDQTFVAVGHTSGNIHLYDLAAPSKPVRSTNALSLPQVLSGRREGHIQGSRIVSIGFVGARHTSIVSGDEFGRAFWWSLGRVVGVESNDVVRMLGSYPDPGDSGLRNSPLAQASDRVSRKPTTLFAATPLPMSTKSHPVDKFDLSALLTPVKLVIVGMKPQAKTWFRKMRENLGGHSGGLIGTAAWLLAGEVAAEDEGISDPVLAYSWGTSVRFLRVRVGQPQLVDGQDSKTLNAVPEFLDGRKWEASTPVRAMSWFDSNHLLLIASSDIILLDVRTMSPIEMTPLQTRLLTTQDLHSSLSLKRATTEAIPSSIMGSVRTHRGKLFLLTKSNVQVGTLQRWNDRILACVHRGDFLSAIQLALAYYEDRAPGNKIGLPPNERERQMIVGARIRELMSASLEWAFSEDRMHDDTHHTVDGRGVDLTDLFENLATVCTEACLSMDDTAFLFDDVYERYAQVGIEAICLRVIEAYIFEERIHFVPPNIVQALIALHEARGEYDLAEAIIWHVNPLSLDINQAVRLCEAHGLWDALIHVYTRAMHDYAAPIVKLLALVRDIHHSRANRGVGIPNGFGPDPESRAQDAYKLFAYLENILSGLAFPTGDSLPESEASYAKSEVFNFIFSGRSLLWPEGSDGEIVLVGDSGQIDQEVPYPYLNLLLHFDTEAFLHAMDIAFEDPYLNEQHSVSRQSIVNLMLDVMDPRYFSSGDITFLHIFVARNLPKYPQFLFIPPSTLHRVLVSLASDSDQSTREDRQLAAEYLLSAYTPHDYPAMLQLFEAAGFWRILRVSYRRNGEYGRLISAFIQDPELDEEIFDCVDNAIATATTEAVVSTEVSRAVVEALPYLLELSVRQTALLLDKRLPSLHAKAINALEKSPHKQMAYLRRLLEPTLGDMDDASGLQQVSTHVDMPARQRYAALLAIHEPSHVIAFLDARGGAFFDLPRLIAQFEDLSFHEGQLWALDRQGRTHEVFETVGKILLAKGVDLGQGLVHNDEGLVHMSIQTIRDVSSIAVRLCREHTCSGDAGVEDMWFGVLNEVVDLVHTLSPLASTDSLDQQVVENLRMLVQDTLSSLVSSTSSSSLSFPRLFKRLVDASNTVTRAKKGRAYAEFRTILTGMLESYRAEGEMLGMTTRLVEGDLFISVAEITVRRQRGWRPHDTMCNLCGKDLWISDDRQEGGQGKLKVLRSGEVVHLSCEES